MSLTKVALSHCCCGTTVQCYRVVIDKRKWLLQQVRKAFGVAKAIDRMLWWCWFASCVCWTVDTWRHLWQSKESVVWQIHIQHIFC